MKKLFSQVTSAIATATLFVSPAFAALNTPPTVPGLSTDVNITDTITKVITYILNFVLIIAVLFVIVAGIRLIISGGDEGQKDKAKQTIIYVIVGIIIILLARVIVTFVNNIVG